VTDSATGITREELAALVAAGRSVALLDVRSADEFATGSVAGARNVLPEQLAQEVAGLPEGTLVVTVCNHGGSRSRGAARTLREGGLADATHLVGGAKGLEPGH
jgi:sulfur-carrier protein adenylyltransferase/sulfurtransferase